MPIRLLGCVHKFAECSHLTHLFMDQYKFTLFTLMKEITLVFRAGDSRGFTVEDTPYNSAYQFPQSSGKQALYRHWLLQTDSSSKKNL